MIKHTDIDKGFIRTEGSGFDVASKHGISFENMTYSQRRFFVDNKMLYKLKDDDQSLYIALKVCTYVGSSIGMVKIAKLYLDEETNTFVDKEQLTINYNTIDWICALSGKPIRSRVDDFSLENFVHPDLHDALKAPMVDSRILKSSVEFRKHIKKLLLNEQQEFLKVAKQSAKNSKLE